MRILVGSWRDQYVPSVLMRYKKGAVILCFSTPGYQAVRTSRVFSLKQSRSKALLAERDGNHDLIQTDFKWSTKRMKMGCFAKATTSFSDGGFIRWYLNMSAGLLMKTAFILYSSYWFFNIIPFLPIHLTQLYLLTTKFGQSPVRHSDMNLYLPCIRECVWK